MFAGSTQRRRTQDMRRQRRQAAADRRIGHDMAYWYEAGRTAKTVLPVVLVVAGAWWVWVNVDRARLAGIIGGVGILVLVVYLFWAVRQSTSNARLLAIANGTRHRAKYWHLAALGAGILILAAVLMVWS